MEAKTNLVVPPSFMQVRKPERVAVWLPQIPKFTISLRIESASVGHRMSYLPVSFATSHNASASTYEWISLKPRNSGGEEPESESPHHPYAAFLTS